jgi:hypothetical protein
MAEGRTMIRVSHVTKAAMDAVAAKLRAATGKATTDNDIIWYLIEQVDPGVAAQMKEIASQGNGNTDEEDDE